MEMKPYIVYVKLDDANRITAVNSSAFLPDTTGWTEIDSGYGDKYHHAQGNYFLQPIMDERGVYRYKLVDVKPVERTAYEMDADYDARPAPEPTTEELLLETAADHEYRICLMELGVSENDL
jgi:hypothetical protein